MSGSFEIEYHNDTGNTDFEVVIFTKNFNVNNPRTYYVAWQVVKAQTKSNFSYPVDLSVGATYVTGGQKISAGPFRAPLGSTWEIIQPANETVKLTQKTGVDPNPHNAIVIKNVHPSTWTGRLYNVGIYKSDRLLVTQQDVHVGDQVTFELKPKLYFGVVRNMQIGEVFQSLEITSALTEFDLSDYPNGLYISQTQEPGGGAYTFTGKHLNQ